jgi:rod shape-determining protein MreC
VALTLALLISLALMNSSTHPAAETFRQGVGSIFSTLTAPFTYLPRTVTVWQENEELRQEVVQLRGQRDQWRDAMLENVRLRRLLGFRDRPEFIYLAAEVIARNPTLNLSSLLLDKGRRDSVRVGQAVVTADGLTGVVHRAGGGSAVALLATDRNFAASARIERSRVDGIVRWAGGEALKMTEVPKNLDVKPGDRVVTSGLGGIIPPGIPIGVVHTVQRGEGLFLDVGIHPFVEFSRLEEVFILVPNPDYVPPEERREGDDRAIREEDLLPLSPWRDR